MRNLILIIGTALAVGALSLTGTASAAVHIPREACELGGGNAVAGWCVGGVYDGQRIG